MEMEILNQILNNIESDIGTIKSDVNILKSDVSLLKQCKSRIEDEIITKSEDGKTL